MSQEPSLAPEFGPVLQGLAQTPPIPTLPVEAVRAMFEQFNFGEDEALAEVRDLQVDGAAGPIAARFYRPLGDPRGLILFYHGGGWVVGNLQSHDKAVRALANRSQCAVLAVDYRLAPEHVFPAGLEDCYAALQWADGHRGDLGLGDIPLAVAGDSAGGNLAAAVAIMARDQQGPALAAQLLIYPATSGGQDSPSYTERGTGGLLTAADMLWFWNHYAPEGMDRNDPRMSVLLTEDLRQLPPAVLIIAEFDPLRDEGLAYGRKLASADVAVTVHHYRDLPHGFMTFYQISPAAAGALDEMAASLKSVFDEELRVS